MIELLTQGFTILFLAVPALVGWYFLRKVDAWGWGDDVPEELHSIESPEEALYRAKRHRRRAEHESWDSDYRSLTRFDSCSCGGSHGRSSRRAVFF